MARSAEKAMSLMNRWVDQQRMVTTDSLLHEKRPRTANECKTVREAESQRYHLIRQLTALLTQIQNPNQSEMRLRQMNDEINKLLKTKFAFELRIKQLGGPDYPSAIPAMAGDSGSTAGGYRYFGAAKNLPGVKELLGDRDDQSTPPLRTKEDIAKNLDLAYYGYLDEEMEPDLVRDEAEAEGVSAA